MEMHAQAAQPHLLLIENIGNTSQPRDGYPKSGTLEGAFEALRRWELDPRLDMTNQPGLEPHPARKPYRGPALSSAGARWTAQGRLWLDGPPIYPEHPQAVTFTANFVNHNFGIRFTTDDPDLIAKMDDAIAQNLARPQLPSGRPDLLPTWQGTPALQSRASDEHPNSVHSGDWTPIQSLGAIKEVRALALWDGTDLRPALQAWMAEGEVPLARGARYPSNMAYRIANEALALLKDGSVNDLQAALDRSELSLDATTQADLSEEEAYWERRRAQRPR